MVEKKKEKEQFAKMSAEEKMNQRRHLKEKDA